MVFGLSEAQREALQALSKRLPREAYLAGGTAIALHLHHRPSRDLDIFFPTEDPVSLANELTTLPDVRITGRAPGTLHLEIGEIPTSLIRYRYPFVHPPTQLEDVPIPTASVDDLGCMKLSAIGQRGARRDFWDLHTIITRAGRTLSELLGAYQHKYESHDIGHVIRSLVYFVDADDEPMPTGLTEEHWQRIQTDLRRWVAAL